MSNHGWVRVVFVCLSACAAVCLAVCLMAFLTSGLWANSPAGASGGETVERDLNDQFTAYIGTDAFQFNPDLKGDLGAVRLYTILNHPDAAAEQDFGLTLWRLEIRGPDGADAIVRAARGRAWLDDQGFAFGEYWWDGRDELGRPAPPGRYQYTFRARFLPSRLTARRGNPEIYEDADPRPGAAAEAFASTGDVVVNYDLGERESGEIRAMRAAGACQLQQNTPLESGWGYNFYYGSTHSHSNYSDGGQSTSNCASGNANGSGAFDPAAVYDYARNQAGMDYWVITDHNHLFDDAVTTSNPPLSASKVVARYQAGRNAALSATVDGAFVAVWGQEFGVLTNSDQGHVIILESPKLFGWEPCSTCTGSTAECTTGNCYFDVYVPKRYAYLTLYQRAVENPSTAGALGILCHPDAGHFDNFAYNTNADAAIQAVAVRSGLAFSTATSCADGNVGSSDYFSKWTKALNLGFHAGPMAEQDAHCANYGVAVPTRTVYLLPNNVTPALTRAAWLTAHKARHFFATEDPNLQLVFCSSDKSHIMGDIWSAGASATLRASVYDPDGESTYALELWRGQVGGGAPTAAYQSVSGLSTATWTESPGTGTWYYFVRVTQSDGHDAWSSPMWITFSGGTVSYSISGDAGTSGALVAAGGYSATADSSGAYTLSNLPAGTYAVTPSKSGCTFSPASLSVTVGPDATGKNFTATCGSGDTQLTSGVALSGQSVAKSAWKYYYITVPSGATSLELKTTGASADVDIYTQFNAKPTSSSYTCRPYSSSGNETCTQASPSAGTWWLGVYGYAAGAFTVTGTVTTGTTTYSISGSAGTSGATVTAGGYSATADSSGNYTLAGLPAGAYTVTPSKSGCTFSPASLAVTVGPSATGKNFTATCGSGDTPLTSGVALSGQSVSQGAWKYYSITVPSGATSLELKTTNASGDVDIYTQFNAKPTSSSYACRPYTSSGNETCTQASPSAGTWWLGVYGYAAGTFTVTGTVATGGGGTPAERLANGGFETITASTNTAPDGSWTRSAYSGTSFNVLVANSSYPHGGSDHAYLGVNNSSSQTLDSAAVTIPSAATTATLSFWVSVVTNETGSTAYDKLVVQLVNSSGTLLTTLATLSNLDKTASAGAYVQKSYSVLGYKGQTVKVRFKATNGTSYTTTFRVDDVSLKTD